MNKIIYLLIFLLFPMNLFSQSRINREKITFSGSSQMIKLATGWSYNEKLGEWIDYKNVISDDKMYKTTYKSLVGGYLSENLFIFSLKSRPVSL